MIAPMRLHSGRVVDLANPDPAAITLEDLAWHLSGIYRWTGASRFTVAQHCVHVHALDGRPWALLHDAEEAFVGDVGHWLKALIGEAYRPIAAGWSQAVAKRFGVEIVSVNFSDQLSAQLEANYLWPDRGVWVYSPTLLALSREHRQIRPLPPTHAQQAWLEAAWRLGLK